MLTMVLAFVGVLGILVVFHEFGHFWVARRCGVSVQTFSVGFGPKLWSKTWNGTTYCLSAIPLGGYVRMLGDDPDEEITPEDKERSFLAQSFSKKAAIVMAGPFFNFLLAFFIFAIVFMAGVPILTPDVGEVEKGSAAALGGIEAGDRILSINGKPVEQWEDIRGHVQEGGSAPLSLTLSRSNTERTLTLQPTQKTVKDIFGDEKTLWVIGITPRGDSLLKRYNPITAIQMGFSRTIHMIELNFIGIVKLIQGKISHDNIGGPLLIAQMAAHQAEQGFRNIALFTAFISINLGLINLFPIPILDGGHLLFFVIERIIGRPLNQKAREIAQQVGMAFLVALMIFAFYNDIVRFFVQPE